MKNIDFYNLQYIENLQSILAVKFNLKKIWMQKLVQAKKHFW